MSKPIDNDTSHENTLHENSTFLEGVKERLEDIMDIGVFYTYGQLIATGKLEFVSENLNDTTKLVKLVSPHKKPEKNIFDW